MNCHRVLWTSCLILSVVLGASVLYAEDDPLGRAASLRNASGEDWNKKDYAAAVEKLTEALAIYDRVEGEALLDRAITMRALVWNQVRSGKVDDAAALMPRLMALAVNDETAWNEVRSAWGAIFEAASAKPDLAAAVRLVDGLRAEAAKAKLERLEGQALHDMGSIARKRGDEAASADYYARAVKRRAEIGDVDGQGWSLNNLANLHLTGERLEEALKPLAAAYELVHTEGSDPAQSAIAWNLRKAIELMHKQPDAKHAAWLQKTAACAASSRRGTWVPAEHLHREALRIAEASGKTAAITKTAQALTKFPGRHGSPEIAADLTIRAALAMARAGKGKKARSLLKKVDVGEGPCAAHLEARRKTALAVAYADRSGKKSFPDAAKAAAAAWKPLEDFAGRREALEQIVEAAQGAGLGEAIPEVMDEARTARRAGGPGGDGGSATSGGDRSGARDVPLRGVAFHIRLDGDKILVEDKIANHKTELPYRWKPSGVTINGLSLKAFGGYIVVTGMNYGGSSAGGSSSGSTTLDALGVYVPLPAKGMLIVQKNGAVRYGGAPVTGGR